MGMDRTFRWTSGGLGGNAQRDFWQIGITVQDPQIPNLPLETPWAPGFVNLAAVLAGATVIEGAVAVARNLAAVIVGTVSVTAGLGMDRTIAASATGGERKSVV